MISLHCSFRASASLGRANRNLSASSALVPLRSAGGWGRAILAPLALLTISATSLIAQPLFIRTPGPNLVGMSPMAMAVGDFDRDGKLDVVSSGFMQSGNEMYVTLAGDGSGGFRFLQSSESGPLPAGTIVTCLAVADFDGNGSLDILRGLSDRGPVLHGITPAFIQGALSGGSDSFAVGDFNGDGKLDFASVGKPGLSVQMGDGVRTFTESFSASITHANQQYLAAGDLNGDGKLDLAVRSPAGVTVLLGDGSGKFTVVTGSPFAGDGANHGNLALADFNADGKPDLASTSSLGVAILLGDGTGKFTVAPGSPFSPDAGSADAPTAVADFNGDGVPDLAIGSSAGRNVTVLLGNGAGKFTVGASIEAANSPRLLTVADFNGDGLPDIATHPRFFAMSSSTGNIAVLLMNKLATLTANPRSLTFYARAGQAAPAAIPVTVTSAATGVAYTAASNQTWLKLNSGVGATGSGGDVTLRPEALQADQPMAAGAYTARVRLAKSDSFGTSVNVTFKVANASGTLRALSSAVAGENPTSTAVADFNADGKPDLAVANWSGNSVTLLLGDGAAGQTASSTHRVGLHPSSVAAGDFNADGKPDVAVTNTDDNNITVLLGDGMGNFPMALGPFPAGCGPASVAVGEFNGDGKPDLAVQDASPSGSPIPIVLIGDGIGRFTSRSGAVCNQSTAPGRASVAVGDFNGDGKHDLVAVSTFGGLVVLVGDGSGNFTAVPNSPAVGSDRGLVVVEDFNGDGKQDLATGGTAGGVMLLLGDGAGRFAAVSSPFLTPFAIQSLAVGDFDGDGRPDIAAQDASNGVTVLVGDGTGNFTMPSGTGWFTVGPFSATLPVSMTVGDFNGDGKPDLAVPANSSNKVVLLLGNPAVTTSSLSSTINTMIDYGTTVPLSLTLSNAEPGFNMPFGAVTFYDGTKPLATLTQTTNTYTFNVVNLPAGIHRISARYAGNERSAGSTSNTITIKVSLGISVGPSVSSGTGSVSPFTNPGLAEKQLLLSPNSRYAAVMQTDGNFVIYESGSAIWSTQTQNSERSPYRLAVQPDGNLVIYGSSDKDVSLGGFGVCRAGSPCIATWSTGPRGGSAPYTLQMQDDGNLVMYDSTSRAVWASGTQRN